METVDIQEGPRGLRASLRDIAVEGCGHGELDKIYETMQHLEQRDGRKIDLLLCCGDFQAVRNLDDLECMACPPKYRSLATFYKYYSGEKVAPYPTIFIGGNHEAANYLWELYHGGWVAPNIFFLGYAGVVNFGGIRIGGLSGIFKQQHYTMGHYERAPYSDSSMRSAYHVRAAEINRLLRLRRPIDVFLSHDWPAGIACHGDTAALFRKKRFLQREIEDGSLGSPPAAQVLETLKPRYWFSAHLHTKFAALVRHQDGKETRFLSLDKCLPGRQFLQVVEFPEANGPLEISYDEEWLAILRTTHSLTSTHPRPPPPPPPEPVSDAQINEVRALLEAAGVHCVPDNFQHTAPPHVDAPLGGRTPRGRMPQTSLRNPQTVSFLNMLGLNYNLDPAPPPPPQSRGTLAPGSSSYQAAPNPEEIDIDDVEEEEANNPEEIELDDEFEGGDEVGEEQAVGSGVDPAIAAVLSGSGARG